MLTKKRINAIIDLLKDKNQRKSFYYVLIRGVSVISNYFFSILIITLFSKEDYGFFVFGLSLFMMLSVLTKFGVDVHFVKVFSKFKDQGFVDAFREFNNEPHNYSWWSYRANSRANNKGWRLDYTLVAQPLQEKLKRAVILSEAIHSDHCPVLVELK